MEQIFDGDRGPVTEGPDSSLQQVTGSPRTGGVPLISHLGSEALRARETEEQVHLLDHSRVALAGLCSFRQYLCRRLRFYGILAAAGDVWVATSS